MSAAFSEADVLASICRESFEDFCREFWECIPGVGTCIWNWHMTLICQTLQEMSERIFRKEPRLCDYVLNVSPGSSKSSLVSVLFPAWFWTRMPTGRIICGSHTDSLVLDLAVKARDVILSEKYQQCFPEIKIRPDVAMKGMYANTLGGERKSCTIAGTSPTGKHSDCVIIDDPIDPKKALSEVELDTAKHFFDAVIPSRTTDKEITPTFLVMQRLAEHDPTGHLLERSKREGAYPIHHICLPAELEKKEDGTWDVSNVKPVEMAKHYVDGLMDPIRLTRRTLRAFRSMGIYSYAGQFLQHPLPPGGSMFREEFFLQLEMAAPYRALRVRAWDRACLFSLSKVAVLDGDRNIKDVVVGDSVMTREGWKVVKWSGPTKEVDTLVSVVFSNGSVVTGTGDHKIWTENRGWVDLDSIRSSDYTLNIADCRGRTWEKKDIDENQIPNGLNSKVLCIAGRKERDTTRRTDGIKTKRSNTRRCFTERSGSSIMGTFPLAMMYTTRTKTGITIQLKILSVSPEKNTIQSTIHLRNSITQRKLRSTTLELQRWPGKMSLTKSLSANSAQSLLNLETTLRSRSSVLLSVESDTDLERSQKIADYVISSFGEDLGRFAARTSAQQSSGRLNANLVETCLRENKRLKNVVRDLVELGISGPFVVHDLEVNECHEFICEDILVHNSTQDGGCYTAGVLMARDDQDMYHVEHCIHGQWEPFERNDRIIACAIADRARYGPNYEPIIYIERERGSTGEESFRHLARRLAGFKVKEFAPTGAKEVRAEPWSDQLAAKNVKFVVNNTWDFDNYTKEHTMFPKGRYKDQVDASSMAFTILCEMKRKIGFRSLSFGRKTKGVFKLIVLSREELPSTVITDHPVILVSLTNPEPLSRLEIPDSGITSLMGTLVLKLADADPAHYQERWEEVLPAYGRKISEVIMTQDTGKQLWRFLNGKYPTNPECVIFMDDGNGDARGLSMAFAVCDIMGLKRKNTLFKVGDPENANEGVPPNQHIYNMTKATRGLVL